MDVSHWSFSSTVAVIVPSFLGYVVGMGVRIGCL